MYSKNRGGDFWHLQRFVEVDMISVMSMLYKHILIKLSVEAIKGSGNMESILSIWFILRRR